MDNRISEQKEYRKKCLEIVESVLCEDVSAEVDLFLTDCQYITRNDYNDMTTERSLIDLCGYPVCANHLSRRTDTELKFKPKQKFKIDSKNNKIYEIDERKQFCSNLCFKSSDYLKQQISEEPIYLRPNKTTNGSEEKIRIRLYDKNLGQMGSEVTFDENIVNQFKKKIVKTETKNKDLMKRKDLIGFPYIKAEYLDQLKDQMNDLTVSERLDPKHQTTVERQGCEPKSETSSTESIKSEKSKSVETLKPVISRKSKLECVESVAKDWITSSTHEFIFGTKREEINYKMITQTDDNIDSEDEQKREKLSKMRFNYMMLCAKLDVEEERDELIDDIILGKAKNGKSVEEYAQEDCITVYNDDFETKANAFFKGKPFSVRNRKVHFSRTEEPSEPKATEEHFIPAKDSEFSRQKRQQIVLSNIEKALNELFESKDSSDLRSDLKDLIKTFRLTAKNVSQNEDSVLMTLFLIRMLIIGKKCEELDKCFDEKPISRILSDFELNKSDIDQKIKQYFQIN